MKLTTNLVLILCLLVFPVYAHDRPKPEPVPPPVNVPDSGGNGSNFWSNLGEAAIWSGVICGACYAADGCRIPFTKKIICRFDKQPVKDNNPSRITPEIPKNEYTYEIKP